MRGLEENKYYIMLSSINDISTRDKNILLERYKELNILFNLKQNELEADIIKLFEKNKKREKIIKNICNENNKMKIEILIEKMKSENIKVITIKDIEYPNNLKNIYDPPICLYYKGNIDALSKYPKIAVIGCRDYSEYGKEIATILSYKLAKQGIRIISGAARGIDSFSHKACIEAKMETIAVLGNGIDYIYPPENKELEEKMIQNKGLIISEYIIGTKPNKYTFPARNRIISGISDGVLVVEAKEKSGTLITTDFALEQGKNIYVVPGNINQKNSYGTNELIKQGAKVVTRIQDVLEDFEIKK